MRLKGPKPGTVFKTSRKDFYVLLCDCSAYGDKDLMICGVYPSLREGREVQKAVKDCPAKHWLKKCSVSVKIT